MTRSSAILSRLTPTATFLTILLPLFLTHGRGLAEFSISALSLLFLIRSVATADWLFLSENWMKWALLWWAWQIFCSLPVFDGVEKSGLTQAILSIRFALFAAALQFWTLREGWARQWMMGLICACTCYIAVQIFMQALSGYNLFGVPRAADGTLTGPYAHSRAAAPLSRLAPPTLMLVFAALYTQLGARRGVILGVVLTALSLTALILAGQRMPTALMLLGIMLCALLYRPYRWVGLIGLMTTPVIMLGVKLFSHRSTDHLITLAHQQLAHFAQSHYGLIFTRVWMIVAQHPWTGLGFDAFRHGCPQPAYFHGFIGLGQRPDGGGAAICVQHAHNHYLQALSNGGWPGLILFVMMVIALLVALWPREGRHHAWRVGLFVAFIVQEWPIASTSDFLNLPLGGWAFLLIGVGLAEARAIRPDRNQSRPPLENDARPHHQVRAEKS